MRTQIWVVSILVQAATLLAGQPSSQSGGHAILISSGSAEYQPQSQPLGDELLREIDDPNTGQRWLLYRDAAHPGGPGRLVPIRTQPIGRNKLFQSEGTRTAGLNSRQGLGSQESFHEVRGSRPSIHSGDRVILEEDSPVVEARLEALALGAAETGARLRVRIVIGGQIVEAIALGAGRAAIAPSGGRP